MQFLNPVYLKNRSVIRVSGKDSFDFLQSIISADINYIKSNKAVVACILSPQGRVIFDFFIMPNNTSNSDKEVLIDCFASEKESLLSKLQIYKLRSNVEINEDKNLKVFLCENGFKNSFKDPRHENLPSRLIGTYDYDSDEDLINKYNESRLKLCVFEGSKEIPRGEALPLDYWMEKTSHLSFEKGCFIGQEVTARIFHRNKIRRRVVTIKSSEISEENMVFKNVFKLLFRSKLYSLFHVSNEFLNKYNLENRKNVIIDGYDIEINTYN